MHRFEHEKEAIHFCHLFLRHNDSSTDIYFVSKSEDSNDGELSSCPGDDENSWGVTIASAHQ